VADWSLERDIDVLDARHIQGVEDPAERSTRRFVVISCRC